MIELELLFAETENELREATKSFNKMASFHEAFAVIKEELDEYWDQCKVWPKSHDITKMRKELIQIAAMCFRAIQDMNILSEAELFELGHPKNEMEGDKNGN